MNPIAPSFVPRPEQPNVPQSITLPTWQPDTEVTHCPICGVRFSMFLRRHHCRKCGRVVCDGCSPHRITIPHPYIVRPPGDPGPALQLSYPGVERGIADFSSIGGGERVRLCNPCVPDPNTAPPQPQQTSRPIIVDGRASRTRPSNEPFGGSSADARPTGHAQEYFPFFPYSSTSGQFPQPNAAAYYSQSSVPHRRVSSAHIYPPHITHFGRLHGSSSSGFVPSFSGLNRPLPRTPTPEPEIPEEDVCPVCHRELPSRSLSNCEALREAHINNCITSHSNYRGDQAVSAITTGNHGTPPPRTTRRTRMFPYVATEKDCVGDVECTICLEEFKVGDLMARLECFCRFHRSCIDSWFVNRPGRCPVHQHDSFGY
ncbi:FYVE zinc finger-domain-containing protein [Xylaria flabelliformis]|nr:FYVE zinc finger-domain-containing protein [Xylaria flabelliformis]